MRLEDRGANLSQIRPDGNVNLSGCKIDGYVFFGIQSHNISGSVMVWHMTDPGTAGSGLAVRYSCAGDSSGQFYLE